MTMCDLRCDVISAKTHHQHPVRLVFFLDVMLRHHSTVSPIYISRYITCNIGILLLRTEYCFHIRSFESLASSLLTVNEF